MQNRLFHFYFRFKSKKFVLSSFLFFDETKLVEKVLSLYPSIGPINSSTDLGEWAYTPV